MDMQFQMQYFGLRSFGVLSDDCHEISHVIPRMEAVEHSLISPASACLLISGPTAA